MVQYTTVSLSRILPTLYLQMFEIRLKLVVEALLLLQPFDLHMITKKDLLCEGVKEYVRKSKCFDCYGVSVYMINFYGIKISRLKSRFQVCLLNVVFATTHFSLRTAAKFYLHENLSSFGYTFFTTVISLFPYW